MWRGYDLFFLGGYVLVVSLSSIVFPKKFPRLFVFLVSLPMAAALLPVIGSGFISRNPWETVFSFVLFGQLGWVSAAIAWVAIVKKSEILLWGAFLISVLSVALFGVLFFALNNS